MKVLLLGSGGREHAIGWKLSQSPLLSELISAPGNPGLAEVGSVFGLDILDPGAVTEFAVENEVDLVVVGPEAPLASGVTDALASAGIATFGPSRLGAQLETSKSFAKAVMVAAGVPTAPGESFTSAGPAHVYLEKMTSPYVVKADGLATGKGVVVTPEIEVAKDWVEQCLGGLFGIEGETVVIEEYLPGREVSVFALVTEDKVITLQPARDYKRIGSGDVGANTGGMGSVSPVDDLDDGLVEWTVESVIEPTIDEMRARGISYTGFLYVGLMLTDDGPMVLEFNCRLGDPETQVVLPRLETDLLELLTQPHEPTWSDEAAVGIVVASENYPETPITGREIKGLERLETRDDILVFHAGTRREDDVLTTSGGRVLAVVGIGQTTETARTKAYEAVEMIHFEGMQLRNDIGQKGN